MPKPLRRLPGVESPFVLRPELLTLVPHSMSTIDRLEAEGKFPGRIRLEPTNRVAWLRREVTRYLRHLAKRRQSAAKEDRVNQEFDARSGRPRRVSPLIQITNSRLPARHQGETQMSEDNSDLLASNQLVGNDQPIEGVIHRGQLALAWLEQLRAKAMERAAKAGDAAVKSSAHVSKKRLARRGRQ